MQKQWLNYHHLYYFLTIANEGSMARAAGRLKVGQSALSTQLAQLEERLGLKLFERQRQRLHLTEAGRIAQRYAREIFQLGDELQDALHDRRQAHRISMQLGALDSIPKTTVAAVVRAAQAKFACTISVIEGRTGELLRALRSHEIDVAVVNHQPSAAERSGLLTRLAGRAPVVALGAKQFAGLKRRFPSSLSGQPFVMPSPDSRLRHDVDSWLKQRDIQPDVVLEAQDFSLLAQLAAQGVGVIPASAAAGEWSRGLGLQVIGELADLHDELWLLGVERRVENPVAAYLLREFSRA